MNLAGSWVGHQESKPSNLSPWSLLWTVVGSGSVGFRVRLLGVYPSSLTHSVTLGKPLNLAVSWFLLQEKIMTPAISDNLLHHKPIPKFRSCWTTLVRWFQLGSSGCRSVHPHTLLGWQIVRWLCFQGGSASSNPLSLWHVVSHPPASYSKHHLTAEAQ